MCSRCGKCFLRPSGLTPAQWKVRKYCSRRCVGLRRDTNDEEIISAYKGGLSSSEIGASLGLSQVQISRIIRAAGVTRTPGDRQKLADPGRREKISAQLRGRECPEHVKNILRARTGSLNAQWRSGLTSSSAGYLHFTKSPANGEQAGRHLHVVIAEWIIGRPLAKGEVVHHVDGNNRNNDPANLQVMSHSAHARLHAIKNKLGGRNERKSK